MPGRKKQQSHLFLHSSGLLLGGTSQSLASGQEAQCWPFLRPLRPDHTCIFSQSQQYLPAAPQCGLGSNFIVLSHAPHTPSGAKCYRFILPNAAPTHPTTPRIFFFFFCRTLASPTYFPERQLIEPHRLCCWTQCLLTRPVSASSAQKCPILPKNLTPGFSAWDSETSPNDSPLLQPSCSVSLQPLHAPCKRHLTLPHSTHHHLALPSPGTPVSTALSPGAS